jgi:positive regulator of sigma E activity
MRSRWLVGLALPYLATFIFYLLTGVLMPFALVLFFWSTVVASIGLWFASYYLIRRFSKKVWKDSEPQFREMAKLVAKELKENDQ